jgi:hypothetical protein
MLGHVLMVLALPTPSRRLPAHGAAGVVVAAP